MTWDEVAKSVIPYMFKIETPQGHGTGFLCSYNEILQSVGVATAYHVVQHSDKWQQPIRFVLDSGESLLLQHEEYTVFSNPDTDSAMILIPQTCLMLSKLRLPETLMELISPSQPLPIGCEVAWLGYPYIAPDKLCFFSGAISAWLDFRKAYLVDGVTINGVSGGPVMFQNSDKSYQVVGFVTAYIPNRATGEAAPGLIVVQDVSYFSNTIATMKSIQEGMSKQNELMRQPMPTGPTGPSPILEPVPPTNPRGG